MATKGLETKESTLYKELKKEIDNVRDLAKKVKAEGVKESIEKTNEIYGKMAISRRERSVLKLATKPDTGRDIGEVVGTLSEYLKTKTDRVETSQDNVLAAIDGITEKIKTRLSRLIAQNYIYGLGDACSQR